jgi:hypothetical protein
MKVNRKSSFTKPLKTLTHIADGDKLGAFQTEAVNRRNIKRLYISRNNDNDINNNNKKEKLKIVILTVNLG